MLSLIDVFLCEARVKMKMHVFTLLLMGCVVVYGLHSVEQPLGDGVDALPEDDRAPWDEDGTSNEASKEWSGEDNDSEQVTGTSDEEWVPDSEPIPATRIGAIHWNWAPRTRKLVNFIIKRWKTRLNTYYDHPTGWRLDHVSIDCWDMKGRGYKLGKGIGDPIAKYLVKNAKKWGVRWVIWYGRIWTPGNGWKKYTDPRDMHYDHVHVTIW